MLSDVAAAPMEMTLLGIQGKVVHWMIHQADMRSSLSNVPCFWV